jgi:hypothetical protein
MSITRMGLGLVALSLLGLGSLAGTSAAADDDARRTAARAAADTFTIAVYPDTQTEVVRYGDTRLRDRTNWLVDRRDQLDLRFVTHVGDLTNWGWLVSSQLNVASQGMKPLEDAGIPYSISVGNHDTRAHGWDGRGGYGGGLFVDNPECLQRFADSECRTPVLLRRTQEINGVFNASRFGAVKGAYEPGKIDNIYSTFSADGLRWMVLNLEHYPRTSVIEWANRVVRDHPTHNVLISTHMYLSGKNTLLHSPKNGETSPRAMWQDLVSRHRNIKIVVSGHVGQAGALVDRGRAGNKVVALRGCFHSGGTNPVRLLRINADANVLRTRVVAPATNERWGRYAGRFGGMSWVR